MSKTVQIRDLDDATYTSLSVKAAREGISVPELLRREAVRMAQRPSLNEWLHEAAGRNLQTMPADPVAVLDELRGSG